MFFLFYDLESRPSLLNVFQTAKSLKHSQGGNGPTIPDGSGHENSKEVGHDFGEKNEPEVQFKHYL